MDNTIVRVIIWIVLGFVFGIVARAILPGKQHIGVLATIFVGIVGALLGVFIGAKFLGIDMYKLTVWSVSAALLGSLLILILWVAVARCIAKK